MKTPAFGGLGAVLVRPVGGMSPYNRACVLRGSAYWFLRAVRAVGVRFMNTGRQEATTMFVLFS